MARRTWYSYVELVDMLNKADSRSAVCALLVIAMDEWKRKEISTFVMAGLFDIASSKIKTL